MADETLRPLLDDLARLLERCVFGGLDIDRCGCKSRRSLSEVQKSGHHQNPRRKKDRRGGGLTPPAKQSRRNRKTTARLIRCRNQEHRII